MAASADNKWWVYVIEASDGRLYTGITTDVDRRFAEHTEGPKGAKFFRGNPPVNVRYRVPVDDRSTASREEARIKKLTRQQKLALIESQ